MTHLAAALLASCILCAEQEPELLPPPTAAPPAIVGYYACQGNHPNGDDYRGVAMVTPSGAGYRILWLYDDGTAAAGTAVLDGGRLLVGFSNGVGVWTIHNGCGGVLISGKYNLKDSTKTGRETMTWLHGFRKEL